MTTSETMRPAWTARVFDHVIDGKLESPASGERFDAINPATGEVIASAARGGTEDVDLAVSAARRAFEGEWSRCTPLERQKMMMRLSELMNAHAEELAELDTLNMGLPYAASLAVVKSSANAMLGYAAFARGIRGATIENSISPDMVSQTSKEPIGVVAAITPWNSPVNTVTGKIGPVLASGCTMVLKPAEQSPLSAVRLGELCLEAGIPPGVVNVVTGFGDAGAALTAHMGVDKVSFTGSVQTGQEIIKASALNLKRLTLELGGKSPDIVFADAELERAVPSASMAAFTLTGQFCAAGSRLLVQRKIYDEFVQRVADFSRTVKVGDPLNAATQLGPVVSDEQLQKVLGFVSRAQSDGHELLSGGERLIEGDMKHGFYVPPTVFAGVGNDSELAQNEVFGPVIAAMPFDDVEEAIFIANQTTFGLASGIWTSNVNTAHRVAAAMDSGMVWINTYGAYDKAVPFGGFKRSGLGVENGSEGIEQYLRTKCIWIDTQTAG